MVNMEIYIFFIIILLHKNLMVVIGFQLYIWKIFTSCISPHTGSGKSVFCNSIKFINIILYEGGK